jgi:hypothetical protein
MLLLRRISFHLSWAFGIRSTLLERHNCGLGIVYKSSLLKRCGMESMESGRTFVEFDEFDRVLFAYSDGLCKTDLLKDKKD